jgi:hypothetical protein
MPFVAIWRARDRIIARYVMHAALRRSRPVNAVLDPVEAIFSLANDRPPAARMHRGRSLTVCRVRDETTL